MINQEMEINPLLEEAPAGEEMEERTTEEEKKREFEQQIQLEQAQRGQALEDFAAQKQIETEAKIAEIQAKGQADIEKEIAKGEIEDDEKEEEFSRDLIKEAVSQGKAQQGGMA